MERLKYIFDQLKRRIKSVHYFGALGLLVGLLWLFVLAYPDNKLHLIFCNVGQGDAILISRKFNQVLIDGGPDESVLKCLSDNMPFWDRKIEIVALTHPQADHLTGLISVLERYQVEYFLLPPAGKESAAFGGLISKIKNQKAKMKLVNPYLGDMIRIGGFTLKTLWPEKTWALAQLNSVSESSVPSGPSIPSSPSEPPLPSQKTSEVARRASCEVNGFSDSVVLGASTSRNLNDFPWFST